MWPAGAWEGAPCGLSVWEGAPCGLQCSKHSPPPICSASLSALPWWSPQPLSKFLFLWLLAFHKRNPQVTQALTRPMPSPIPSWAVSKTLLWVRGCPSSLTSACELIHPMGESTPPLTALPGRPYYLINSV